MFKVGDYVKWESQAQGYTKEKHGQIAEVLSAGERPSRLKFPHLYKNAGCGSGRDHESYVVLVGKKPYWPRASALRRVHGVMLA